MVVWSCCRAPLGTGARLILSNSKITLTTSNLQKCKQLLPVRQMSAHRTMTVKPSRLEWDKFKDDFHFFFLLGVIPLGLVILYSNMFIGQAELVDIPEDYEPKHWEYYKGPIQRWFARTIYDSPEKSYEKCLHYVYVENEKKNARLLERKVKALMQKRDDYKGWYYVPMDKTRIEAGRENRDDFRSRMGTRR
ncbi:hypothetical protein ScPMuIL_008222 [Solemya velum]